MITGYHAGGLLYHDPVVAVRELAAIGFQSIAIRPHGASLNPHAANFGQQVLRLSDAISKAGVRCVLDLDSPFLPDPLRPRGPSLASSDAKVALEAREWVTRWIAIGSELGAELITFSSGCWGESGEERDEKMLERFSAQLRRLLKTADIERIQLALHPRCGDAIATVAQFERLGQWLDPDDGLLLAADIGEMLTGSELPVADRLARNLRALACVYLCDRRAGFSGDQRFGQGDVALGRILRSLSAHDYRGHAIARVEGHSELGFTPAREAIQIMGGRD